MRRYISFRNMDVIRIFCKRSYTFLPDKLVTIPDKYFAIYFQVEIHTQSSVTFLGTRQAITCDILSH